MKIRQFTLSSQAKEQLIRLKARTGIDTWNTLCRWGFCLSLREESPPTPVDIPSDSNVELTWQVFGGEHAELYMALLIERMIKDKIEITDKDLSRQFRLHLHRGIGYLATPGFIRNISSLAGLATGEVHQKST
ncbi:MAG: DNA sulfur modification protein DndE [Planctomycetaceae bacterium]